MTGFTTPRRRAYWLKKLHQWHWVSSALCLMGMLLFALTGITLNHAGGIESRPRVQRLQAQAPAPVVQALQSAGEGALPPVATAWVREAWAVDVAGREADWARDEVAVSMPRPGGDAWLRIALDTGEAEYESTDRGWVAYFNDLHKGRHTGTAWQWLMDAFAVACLVFTVTGLVMLKMHAKHRPLTWPMVGAGLVVPLLIALWWVH